MSGATEVEQHGVGARPRVVIVDDHHLFRAGVRAELGEELSMVGDAGQRRAGGGA